LGEFLGKKQMFLKTFLREYIFDEKWSEIFWGVGVGPLGSQWEISYSCVIHYEAIFLTVSELLAKMSDFFLNFRRILVPN